MSFLQKGNREATVRSATIWAIGGMVVGLIIGAMIVIRIGESPLISACMLVWMALGGAVSGFAINWQIDDGPDDDDA